MAATKERPLKLLMLHGYTQSGHLFHAKTKALERQVKKAFPAGIDLVYPTAPIRIQPSDIPNYLSPTGEADNNSQSKKSDENADTWGWWVRRGSSEPYTYDGMELGLEKVAQVLKDEGPFDGVLGFSQGGALAGMVASLLEQGRREAFIAAQSKGGMSYPTSFEDDSGMVEDIIHPPLKFAVSYSGFGASTNALYQAYYNPKIQTPMLHFLGSVDTVVEEARSLRLVAACADGGGKDQCRVIRHPGGHFLPSSQKQYVNALIGFIKEAMGWTDGAANGAQEESVEDMKMPF